MPPTIADVFSNISGGVPNSINEIRIRRNKPIIIYVKNVLYFITINSRLVSSINSQCVLVNDDDFDFISDRLCNHSYHTNMEGMINGYITAKNGSRVGIGASAVKKDGKVTCVKDISSLCIRIAHEHKNCSRKILNSIYIDKFPSIIVAGPPGSGKTTFLRDMAFLLSNGFNGKYRRVALVDERRELTSGFITGVNTDSLIGFDKAKGIEMAARTLSPEIIMCDEIGNHTELEAIKYSFSTGCRFAVSVHMQNAAQMFTNKIVQELIKTNEFNYMVLLKSYTDEYEIIDISEEKIENNRNNNDYPFFIFPWGNGGRI